MSEPTPHELFERCERFEQASAARASTTVKQIDLGTAYLNSDLSKVWDRNFLWLGPGAAKATAQELIDTTEQVLSEAGVAHRKFLVPAEHLSADTAQDLAGAGWEKSELVTMVLRNRDVGAKSDQVEEMSPEEFVAFNRVITAEFSEADEVVDQLVQLGELMATAANARFFVTIDEGKPVASTHLYSDGATAQIEDVGTLEAHRGKGYSKVLMHHVIADAFENGHDTVFLVAETDDWPKDFYERLGFESVGYTLEFKPEEEKDKDAEKDAQKEKGN